MNIDDICKNLHELFDQLAEANKKCDSLQMMIEVNNNLYKKSLDAITGERDQALMERGQLQRSLTVTQTQYNSSWRQRNDLREALAERTKERDVACSERDQLQLAMGASQSEWADMRRERRGLLEENVSLKQELKQLKEELDMLNDIKDLIEKIRQEKS